MTMLVIGTSDEEGTYHLATRAFGELVKGSVGVLATENPPLGGTEH
jgi:hypothetical protein